MADVPDACGFDLDTVTAPDAVVAIRSYPRRFRALVSGWDDDDADALVRRRPDPSTWSAIEYVGHVADVFDLYAGRIEQVLVHDRPRLASFDQDAAVEAHAGAPVDDVVGRLQAGAERLAKVLSDVPGDGWERTGIRGDGEERSVLWMARQSVHEAHHHLRDVERVVRAVRGRVPTVDGDDES